MIELNLWFSPTTGNTYGNLTNKITRVASNIGNLLPLAKFCDLCNRNGTMDHELLELFINDPHRDHAALYAWTRDKKSLVWWNPKTTTAAVFQNSQLKELKVVTKRYDVKGAPDVCFRG